MKLEKYKNNPILSPNPNNDWESLVTTNPASYYDEERDEVILIYRAAGFDKEHRVNLGIAKSKNGYDFERVSDKPLFEIVDGTWDSGSIEDPRIVKIDDYYFITYAAVNSPPGKYWLNEGNNRDTIKDLPPSAPIALRNNETRTGLAITKDFKTIYRPGYLTDPTLDDRDVILFPRKINNQFILLHRPLKWVGEKYGTENPAIWISKCDDLLENKKLSLLAKSEFDWEYKIGGSAPPIETEFGWFMLYHAVGVDKQYRIGAMLLDLDKPEMVTHRLKNPIMVPEYDYELIGLYNGICFPCGNFVKGDKLFVYYGGADQYVGVATCNFSSLLNELLENPIK